jgi:hypothetical protein
MKGCVYTVTELLSMKVHSLSSLGLQPLALVPMLIVFRMYVIDDLLNATAKVLIPCSSDFFE